LRWVGIAIISSAGSDEGPARDPRRSVIFGLLTALGFGGYLVAMDPSSEWHVAWALLVARLTAVAAFAAIFLARRRPLAVTPGGLPVLALIGALIIGPTPCTPSRRRRACSASSPCSARSTPS
jgi:drug/metabolite transporter (DMT)-like permease